MKKIKQFIQYLRLLLILPGIDWKDPRFMMDLNRWRSIGKLSGSNCRVLAVLLWEKTEFRNLLIYRNRFRRLFRYWIAFWYRPMETLYIEAKEIGGGLFIQHGFATMITAEAIGENCWINQQVTIGYSGRGRAPVIGDNVMITCGAKVLGAITVGDRAVIGANAVVIRDVEPGAVMGGVPARVLRKEQSGGA